MLNDPDSFDRIQFFGRYEESPSCDSPVGMYDAPLTDSSCLLTWPVTTFQMNATLTFKLTEFAYFFFSAQIILSFIDYLLNTWDDKNPNKTLIA